MKYSSLKTRFARTIFFTLLIFGSLVYLSFHVVTGNVVRHLGTNFAVKEALLSKSKLMSAIQGDLSLSLNMSRSPVLMQWVREENNPTFKSQALRELENYRKSLYGGSVFFVIDRSGNYYFDGGGDGEGFHHPRYALSAANMNDSWYFRTLNEVDEFELNVDFNNQMNLTKIWFNVILRDDEGTKVGICGSAIDISEFIEDLMSTKEKGIETVLFRQDGAITGSREKSYVLHNSRVRGSDELATVYALLDSGRARENLEKAVDSVSSGDRDVETFNLTIDGRSYLAALSYLEKIDWFNLVLVDPEHFVGDRDFLPILAAIVAATLAILAIIGFLLNRLILAPLSDLAVSSEIVSGGEFNHQIRVRSNDEIGALARSFNSMTLMVRDYTENLESKVRVRTEELDRSNRKLAESNRKILDSIRFARLIQSSILPDEAALRECARDFFVLYRPREIVGGDFHYFRKVGEVFFLAVVDCTGHGVSGAFMTMTAKAVLDRVLDDLGDESPAAVLGAYNRLMRAALQKGDDRSLDHGLEIGLCRIVPEERSMTFAGAGIDLHCLSEDGLEVIGGDRQAIGYRRSDVNFTYSDHIVSLEEGATFYLATDGILDQAGGPRGWSFGRKRFRDLLEEIAKLRLAQQREAIETALARYQGDIPQRDDITVIGFRV